MHKIKIKQKKLQNTRTVKTDLQYHGGLVYLMPVAMWDILS